MTDLKTTVSGAVAVLAIVFKFIFKVDLPDEVVAGIVATAIFFVGFFAKDKGGTNAVQETKAVPETKG